jgi:vacuolar-type H+-ATPase subunit E/Vma4
VSFTYHPYSRVKADGNDRAGGVKLTSRDTKVKIDNTLDERLRLLEDQVTRYSNILDEY